MSLATFKDLCIDAGDAIALGAFWSNVLGLELHHRDDGQVFLSGARPEHTVWVNQVSELKKVKHRIHLDVHATAERALVALGATVADRDSFEWTVMHDPEDGEFCLFSRAEPPDYRLYEIVVDCSDHRSLAAWWQQLLGGAVGESDEGYSFLERIPGVPFDCITFAPVPEPKIVKNRVHLDVRAASVEPILAAGATALRSPDDEIRWHVLADPEGNEFCVFVDDRSDDASDDRSDD
jgi:catechol 2,3-dioxygenase-like lactoylglutathione lyase family enzyme